MMPEKEFREKNNVRMCEKCCATCAYGIDLCDDGIYSCKHPDLAGDYIMTSSESVCNAWTSNEIPEHR